jgi:hypothetical protein
MPYASVKLKYEYIQTSLHSFSCLSFSGHKIPTKQLKRGMDKVVLRSCMYVNKH